MSATARELCRFSRNMYSVLKISWAFVIVLRGLTLTFSFILWNFALILIYLNALGWVYIVTGIRELLRTCLGTLFEPPEALSCTAYLKCFRPTACSKEVINSNFKVGG